MPCAPRGKLSVPAYAGSFERPPVGNVARIIGFRKRRKPGNCSLGNSNWRSSERKKSVRTRFKSAPQLSVFYRPLRVSVSRSSDFNPESGHPRSGPSSPEVVRGHLRAYEEVKGHDPSFHFVQGCYLLRGLGNMPQKSKSLISHSCFPSGNDLMFSEISLPTFEANTDLDPTPFTDVVARSVTEASSLYATLAKRQGKRRNGDP